MSAFRTIQILMLLHLTVFFTAVTSQYSAFVVRDGDDNTLPCENVVSNRRGCKNTKWLFRDARNTPAVELVVFGKIAESSRSDRLRVTRNCSLVIKKVTAEDVGRYTCRQFESGRQRGGDAHVYLSVVTLSLPGREFEDKDTVTVSCSVLTYAWCTQRLKWLFKGEDVDGRDVKTSQSYCSANVTFRTSHEIRTSLYESLACQATDIFTGDVKQFAFRLQPSGENLMSCCRSTFVEFGVLCYSFSFSYCKRQTRRLFFSGEDATTKENTNTSSANNGTAETQGAQ
uniref:uncharacterized protein LOC124050348 isoform X2 n=1 Tax=Scatophagus argus TaxID=75038 RepID=UPI001ED85D19|nr:uncharacterized protein LOC124050348 isoform X2 [Scatophagus argus]